MNILSRLFGHSFLKGGSQDLRAPVRPLWHRTVELARAPEWYAECGVADTVPGRFDALALVLALVMLRMERDEALIAPSALLSELFIEDMDGQLRQAGVGDLVVGKRIGKLMGALGGRIAALREALPLGETALAEVAARNVTMTEAGDPAKIAARLRALANCLDGLSGEELLAGRIAPSNLPFRVSKFPGAAQHADFARALQSGHRPQWQRQDQSDRGGHAAAHAVEAAVERR